MDLSVAHTFEPGLLERLAAFPQVREIYGCKGPDLIGSGRSAYTIRPVGKSYLAATISEAHQRGIAFNYLLNSASLNGMEQTRAGHRAIRRTLDALSELNVDAVTVALPLLLRIVKHHYPHIRVRAGAFAAIDSPAKALAWENMGADTLCVSAIACNRDFERLVAIRSAVRCDLELIANASCLPACMWEQTHMHVLSQSATKGHALKGFCFDYCFVQCSRQRLSDPVNYLRSVWIRPEDLRIYEDLGYFHFKIVERSCPADLLVRRVAAYCSGSFEGNLWELVAPVAWIKSQQRVPWPMKARMIGLLARPRLIKIAAMLDMKRFSESVIPHEFSREAADVYIDNRSLDGFLEGLRNVKGCARGGCRSCMYCRSWTDRAVAVNLDWRSRTLALADRLDRGLLSGAHWGLEP